MDRVYGPSGLVVPEPGAGVRARKGRERDRREAARRSQIVADFRRAQAKRITKDRLRYPNIGATRGWPVGGIECGPVRRLSPKGQGSPTR